MNIKVLDQQFDEVINSHYLTASVSYGEAVEYLCPLMNRLSFQRNPLRKGFYERLEQDIAAGCIMPNITIAIKTDEPISRDFEISDSFISDNLKNAFILDGIQRLNTLSRVAASEKFPKDRCLYCNVLFCDSMDKLLYRMITLNNGQKPMTARHQIEILASNMFDFDSLPILAVTEKEKSKKKKEESMSKEVLIKGYLAFVSASINIDNQKIIEEKMNELLAEKIMESNIVNNDNEFEDVIHFVNDMLVNEVLNIWFKVPNNFIAFCASMNKAFDLIKNENSDSLEKKINLFESAFSALDVSKIKLGSSRRKLVFLYFSKIDVLSDYSVNDLIDCVSQEL